MSDSLIAVITAMEQEAKTIFPKGKKEELNGIPVLKGTLKDDREYICMIAGVGPIMAAKGALELCKLSPSILISMGVSGGLAPGMNAGETIVGTAVHSNIPGVDAWHEKDMDREERNRLIPRLKNYPQGPLMGVAKPVMDISEKLSLHETSGALAVDMESLSAARIAAGHKTPFAVVRAVSDCSECSLPEVILESLDESGNPQIWPIVKAILKKPPLLFKLIKLGKDYSKALNSLGEIFK